MITDFTILCAETVPANYTWDLQIPLEGAFTNTQAYTLENYVSGYAPAVRVVFGNNSFSDFDYSLVNFTWNFGDFYHDYNNTISLTCVNSLVQHTYIMPGIYTVSLIHTQTKPPTQLDQTGLFFQCQTKYDIQWSWNFLSNINCITWDETKTGATYEKWWANEEACLGKYCKYWSWYSLAPREDTSNIEVVNPIKWKETNTGSEFEKLWTYETNNTICENYAIDTLQQPTIKTATIEVIEIPPTAGMSCESPTSHGASPHIVQLSPRHCKAGSFPIDRIDWDFNDGTPIKTITRYAPPSGDDIVYNGVFISDVLDVRNYDVLHTYYRNKDNYPMFYPSLTCYSANTNTFDECCITIGPIELPNPQTDIHLLKTRNTLKGNIHVLLNNDTPALLTTTQYTTSLIPNIQKTPPTKIRNKTGAVIPYTGYNGNNFPQLYIPSCDLDLFSRPERYLTTEDSTFDNITDNLSGTEGTPITLEQLNYFIDPGEQS